MYRQLPTSPASPDILSVEGEKNDAQLKSSSRLLGPRLCFALCAICTVVNLALSFLARDGPSLPVAPPVTRKNIHLLRRPSQFIRFDEIERPSPPAPKQFENYPILLAQIDSSDTSKVFPDDPRKYMSHVGTISPEDRRVLVSETVSLLS